MLTFISRFTFTYEVIDQGYTFKIVTNLTELCDAEAKINKFAYATPEDDLKLLRSLLSNERENEMEKEQRAEDTAIKKVSYKKVYIVLYVFNRSFLNRNHQNQT